MQKCLHDITSDVHDIANERKEEYTNKETEIEMYAVVNERETEKRKKEETIPRNQQSCIKEGQYEEESSVENKTSSKQQQNNNYCKMNRGRSQNLSGCRAADIEKNMAAISYYLNMISFEIEALRMKNTCNCVRTNRPIVEKIRPERKGRRTYNKPTNGNTFRQRRNDYANPTENKGATGSTIKGKQRGIRYQQETTPEMIRQKRYSIKQIIKQDAPKKASTNETADEGALAVKEEIESICYICKKDVRNLEQSLEQHLNKVHRPPSWEYFSLEMYQKLKDMENLDPAMDAKEQYARFMDELGLGDKETNE